MPRTRRTAIFALAVCLAAPACTRLPGEPALQASVPADAASIIGEITQVERSDDGPLRILVEQIPSRSAGEPIAWITVNRRTDVLQRAGGSLSAASPAEFEVGMRVQVWFTGPVAESFPVQATAGTILIER